MSLMYSDVSFDKNANKNQVNFLRQQSFLRNVLERLEKEPEIVIKELKEVLDEIRNPDRITVHMATDLQRLSANRNPSEVWKNFLPMDQKTKNFKLNIIPESKVRLVEDFQNITGFITGVGSVESAYLQQSTASISDYRHWDLPSLLVAIQYLTQLEGPMWKEIRGKGLAYSYRITLNANEGMLSLYLTRAAQLAGAYEEAQNILSNHINGSRAWEDDLLESAKSSLIYEVIDREAQISNVMQQSLFAYYREVPPSYNKDLLSKIVKVTVEDVKKAAVKYFTPLIQASTSKTVIVCHPSKSQEIIDVLNSKFNHNLKYIENIEDSRFSK